MENKTLPQDLKALRNIFLDFTKSKEERKASFYEYYKLNPENIEDVISQFTSIYSLSSSSILEDFLYEISIEKTLNVVNRIEIAKSISDIEEQQFEGYKALQIIFSSPSISEVNKNYYIESLMFLMNYDVYKESSVVLFLEILTDENIKYKDRYSIILSLEYRITYKTLRDYYSEKAFICILENLKTPVNYKILSCQYLLKNTTYDAETFLKGVCMNEDLEDNIRADSADTLIKCGSEDAKKFGRDIIYKLSYKDGGKGIYENSQNVHDETIDKSVSDILIFLNEKVTVTSTFKEIVEKYKKGSVVYKFLEKHKEKHKNIELSLDRIEVDRILYTIYNLTLSTIFCKVYQYIETFGEENKETLFQRLEEELIEMANTCSSGFSSRLINTLSGFEDFSIKISWEEQITGNLLGRFNKKIREMKDKDAQEFILIEMVSKEKLDRPNLLKFFRENISSIRDELYQEFKEYISDTDFDLYFKRAMIIYES